MQSSTPSSSSSQSSSDDDDADQYIVRRTDTKKLLDDILKGSADETERSGTEGTATHPTLGCSSETGQSNENNTQVDGAEVVMQDTVMRFMEQACCGIIMAVERATGGRPPEDDEEQEPSTDDVPTITRYKRMLLMFFAEYLNGCWLSLLREDDAYVVTTIEAINHPSPRCLLRQLFLLAQVVFPDHPMPIGYGRSVSDPAAPLTPEQKLAVIRQSLSSAVLAHLEDAREAGMFASLNHERCIEEDEALGDEENPDRMVEELPSLALERAAWRDAGEPDDVALFSFS